MYKYSKSINSNRAILLTDTAAKANNVCNICWSQFFFFFLLLTSLLEFRTNGLLPVDFPLHRICFTYNQTSRCSAHCCGNLRWGSLQCSILAINFRNGTEHNTEIRSFGYKTPNKAS